MKIKHFLILIIIAVLMLSACTKDHDFIHVPTMVEIVKHTQPPTVVPTKETQKISFTDEDIADAKALIEKYYDARAQKDPEAIIACYHPSKLTMEEYNEGGICLFEQEEIALVKIHEYDLEWQKAFNPYEYTIFPQNNVIVFKIDYKVSFPNGGADNSAYDEGMYYDWAMVLVRDDKDSQWLIHGQGY